MDASCSNDVSKSNEFSGSFTKSDELVYSETVIQTVILIQMNVMKTIFLEICQLQWTFRIKIMMIMDSERSGSRYYPNSYRFFSNQHSRTSRLFL